MTFEVLRHSAKWDMKAYLFGMKAPIFEKRINKMIDIIADYAYPKFFVHYEHRYTMSRLIDEKKTFRNFKMCRYANDVTFQQSFRPGGSLEESKKFFSGKYKLYVFKVTFSVLPNYIAINANKKCPGSVLDI